MADAPPHAMEPVPRYSLAEIDGECRKAARGAGCPWGIAEEAGKAARWLAERGLPGPEALARLLLTPRNCPCGGDDGPGCPLRIGAALSDTAETIAAGEGHRSIVAQPLIVFAIVGRAAAATGATFTVRWNGAEGVCGPHGFTLTAPSGVLADVATLTVSKGASSPAPVRGSLRASAVDPGSWSVLNRYASQTYAPATEASRQRGAGAGGPDND